MKKILCLALILCSFFSYADDYMSDTYKADFKKSLPLAQAGNIKAQVYVGYLYDEGKGIKKDKQQAFYWYLKAAEQGNVTAQNLVAFRYWAGKGVRKDRDQAIQWYRKSASQGHDGSQHALGEFYCVPDQGVRVQYEACYALLSLAAMKDKSGMSQAVLEYRAAKMTEEEIKAGKDLAKEMEKPNNLLIALDNYIKTHPASKVRHKYD